MKLFNTQKPAAQSQAAATQRQSLAAFKARADQSVVTESIDRITGGALSGCHTGGKLAA